MTNYRTNCLLGFAAIFWLSCGSNNFRQLTSAKQPQLSYTDVPQKSLSAIICSDHSFLAVHSDTVGKITISESYDSCHTWHPDTTIVVGKFEPNTREHYFFYKSAGYIFLKIIDHNGNGNLCQFQAWARKDTTHAVWFRLPLSLTAIEPIRDALPVDMNTIFVFTDKNIFKKLLLKTNGEIEQTTLSDHGGSGFQYHTAILIPAGSYITFMGTLQNANWKLRVIYYYSLRSGRVDSAAGIPRPARDEYLRLPSLFLYYNRPDQSILCEEKYPDEQAVYNPSRSYQSENQTTTLVQVLPDEGICRRQTCPGKVVQSYLHDVFGWDAEPFEKDPMYHDLIYDNHDFDNICFLPNLGLFVSPPGYGAENKPCLAYTTHPEKPWSRIATTLFSGIKPDATKQLAYCFRGDSLIGLVRQTGYFPAIASVRFNSTPSSLSFAFAFPNGAVRKDLEFQLYFKNELLMEKGLDSIALQGKTSFDADSGLYTVTVPTSGNKLNLRPGDHFSISAVTRCKQEGDQQLYDLGDFFYEDPYRAFLRQHWGVAFVLAGITGVYILLFLLHLINPGIPLRFHQSQLYPLLKDTPGKLGPMIRWLYTYSFEKLFIDNSRTVDYWTKSAIQPIITHFNKEPTVREKDVYLPITLSQKNDAGAIINTLKQADLQAMDGLISSFGDQPIIIQLIGNGGAGKSTMGYQLAKWMNATPDIGNKQSFNDHFWLPILIEEETDDLTGAVLRKLDRILRAPLSPTFLSALLKRKRVLVIIDGFSEKTTKAALAKQINADLQINALLITTRKMIQFDKSFTSLLLYPEPISSKDLLPFILALLQIKQINGFGSISSQGLLAARLSELFRYKNVEMPITPLLVNLVLEKIKRKSAETITTECLLKEIPSTIPGIYIEYIYSVNKPTEGYRLTNDELLSIAQWLAVLCLEESFIPHPISITSIKKELNNGYPIQDADTLVKLLDANGLVQISLFDNALPTVSYILDPLAENLAAFSYARKLSKDVGSWEQFYQQLRQLPDRPIGFIQALVLIHHQFWKIEGWADPNEVEQFKAMEGILLGASQAK